MENLTKEDLIKHIEMLQNDIKEIQHLYSVSKQKEVDIEKRERAIVEKEQKHEDAKRLALVATEKIRAEMAGLDSDYLTDVAIEVAILKAFNIGLLIGRGD